MKTVSLFLHPIFNWHWKHYIMFERRRKNIQQYIVKSPIFRLFYKWKTSEKNVVFNRQNFTRASNLSERRNSPVKITWVNFLHQVNCETKYIIPGHFKWHSFSPYFSYFLCAVIWNKYFLNKAWKISKVVIFFSSSIFETFYCFRPFELQPLLRISNHCSDFTTSIYEPKDPLGFKNVCIGSFHWHFQVF